MDEIRQTRWLLAQRCPVCEQGFVLHLVACPECDSLGTICDEDGAGYLNARAVSGEAAVDPESTPCAKCGALNLADFLPTSSDRILEAGFTPSDFEGF